jgi:hypothetical protein
MTGPAHDVGITPGDLASLQQQYPAFRIWQDVTGEHARLVAVCCHAGTSPHTVVTTDADELRAVLSGSHQPMTVNDPGAWDQYPQAIADDYPGWAVQRNDGQWGVWCPAVTVHATTPADLRAAIEQAITGPSHPATPSESGG